MTTLTVFEDQCMEASAAAEPKTLMFFCWDHGTVFTATRNNMDRPGLVRGTIERSDRQVPPPPADDEQVHILVRPGDAQHTAVSALAFVRRDQQWEPVALNVVPLDQSLRTRRGSLLDSDLLQDAQVLTIGTGSMFAPVVRNLARAGVGHLGVMDHDRLETGNVVRHPAGLPHVGRLKVDFMRDAIQEQNPFAQVRTWPERATWDRIDRLRSIINAFDLVLVGADEDETRRLVNRVGFEAGKPMIFGGAFRRACGGQVLRVRPGEQAPCFQCFAQQMPQHLRDREVADEGDAARLAYSDRPVEVEPGLSIDIAPMSQMIAKLALHELIRDKPSMLHCLDEDLVAPLMLWLNRREPGTVYEHLEPLEFNVDGFHVMRWYGLDLPQDPSCPVCGDYIGQMAKAHGISDGELHRRARAIADLGKRGPKG